MNRLARRAIATVSVSLLVLGLLPGAAMAIDTTAVNDPPIAVDDPGVPCGNTSNFGGSFPIPEDYRGSDPADPYNAWFVLFGPCGLLGNDSDPNGDALTYEFLTDPAHGDVLKIDESFFAYRPDPDWGTLEGDLPGGDWVSDSFTYRAFDGQAYSQPATMRFWVAQINDVPTFIPGDDMVIVEEGSGQYSGQWATNVSPGPNEAAQTVGFRLDGPAQLQEFANGELFIDKPAIDGDGVLTFTLTPGVFGYANVTMVAKDDGGMRAIQGVPYTPGPDDTSDAFTFQIVVTEAPENGAPEASNDTFSVPEGAAATSLDVLANDDDPEGDDVTIVGKTDGAHGVVAITGDGTGVTYDPAPLYDGPDSFTYTIQDPGGQTDTATVSVTVIRDAAPPSVVAPAQRFLTQTVGGTLKTRITWSATDAGSGVKAYTVQQSTTGGTWTTIPLATPTRTFVDRSLTDGVAYRFRVRATDGEGNISPWQYSSTFKPARFQEGTALATYVGTWGTWKHASHLGGATRYAGTLGRTATFKATAYDIALVVARTTTSGSADLYVDGVFASRVNLRATSTRYRQLVFTRHFATLASHTIEIRPIGTGRVDLDAFVVLR